MNKMKLIITIFLPLLAVSSLLLPIKSAYPQPSTKNWKHNAVIEDLFSKLPLNFNSGSFNKMSSSKKKKSATFRWSGQFSAEYDEKKNDKYFTSWIEGEWDVIIKAKLELAFVSDSIWTSTYSIKSVSLKIPLKYFCWEETINDEVEPIKYISEDYEITLDSMDFDLTFNLGSKKLYENSFLTESSVSQNDVYTKYIYLKYDKQEVFTTPKGSMLKLGGHNYGLYEGGFFINHVEKSGEIIGLGTFPTNTAFQRPDGYNTLGDLGDFFYTFRETTSNCNTKVTFSDKEDTTRIVSGAASDGESKVIIQISNLCDDVSKKDIKITISEQDGQLEDDKKIVDGVFTQTWKAPENFVREGQDDDLDTGKRELNFQITIKGEEVAAPDFYLFKPPVVLVHGIWANAGSLKSMEDYLKENYSEEWVFPISYTSDLHFASNITTVSGRISGIINAVKNNLFENPIVVKQADVVAHSMGGILTGLYVASNDYENNINRLVTIGTPHSGSEMANFTLHFLYNEMT